MDWQFQNWLHLGYKCSWRLFLYEALSFPFFFSRFKTDFFYRFVEKKNQLIFEKLSFLKKEAESVVFVQSSSESIPNRRIWVLWWQGEEAMPPIVKLCYHSILKNANGAEVVLLSEKNINKYVHIPEVISRYIGSSIMPTAVITDYIRVSLLASYGGLWLDATILVSSPIEEYYFSKQFYTLHTPYEHSPYVSNNRIHCYVLGGEKNSPVFKYVQNAFEEYWSRFDFLINYYLIDYIIMYGYWNSSAIREYIDGLEYTSTTLYEIYSLLDKPLDESRIMRLLQENKFSKLSWKGNLSCNPDSNYAFLNKLYF